MRSEPSHTTLVLRLDRAKFSSYEKLHDGSWCEKRGRLSRDDSCTSNDAESNNHVLKGAADKEEMSTIEFMSLSKSLALNQCQAVIRAVLKSREYGLKEIYSSLQVAGDWWYQISKEQKMRHLKRVMETPVTKSKG